MRHRDVYHYDLKSFEDFVIASPDDLVFDDIAFGSSQIIEQNKWQHFLDQDIQNYESGRDYLPEVLTSQLSVALAYGLLDIIEILMIYWRVMMKMRQTMKHLYVNSFLENFIMC